MREQALQAPDAQGGRRLHPMRVQKRAVARLIQAELGLGDVDLG